MKVPLVSVVLLAAVVLAEPPRPYRQQYQQQPPQYYYARQQEEAAPYRASGWRPDGPAFNLPQRQYSSAQQQQQPQQQYYPDAAPQQQYGAPDTPQRQYGGPQQQLGGPQQRYAAPTAPRQQYGGPQQQYGAPTGPQREYGAPEEATTTETPDTTEEEEVSTVQSIAESESEPVNAANELEGEDQDENKQPQQTGEYYVALPDGRLQRVRYVSRQDVEAMRYFAKIRAENVEPLRGPIYAYAPLQRIQIVPVAPSASSSVDANKPQKLEIEPVAAQVQYQYDNPASVVPLASPFNTNTYTANYQTPRDSRFLLTFQ